MKNKRLSTDQKGFTLIELILVISIIAIITTIAIPNFMEHLNHAKIQADQSNAVLIVNATLSAIANNEIHPPSSSKWKIIDKDEELSVIKKYLYGETFPIPQKSSGNSFIIQIHNTGKVNIYYSEDTTYGYPVNEGKFNDEEK